MRYKAIYHVAPLLRLEHPEQMVMTKVENCRVAIVWAENRAFDVKQFFNDRTAVVIVVQPMDNANCVGIAVKKRDNSLRFGICDQPIVVSKALAGVIVEWTAVFACLAIKKNTPKPTKRVRRIGNLKSAGHGPKGISLFLDVF
jgi:hypothetical protein